MPRSFPAPRVSDPLPGRGFLDAGHVAPEAQLARGKHSLPTALKVGGEAGAVDRPEEPTHFGDPAGGHHALQERVRELRAVLKHRPVVLPHQTKNLFRNLHNYIISQYLELLYGSGKAKPGTE